jgi:flagellin-specific chaperone FliS
MRGKKKADGKNLSAFFLFIFAPCVVKCNTAVPFVAKRRTERAGFDLPSLCNIINKLILQLNANKSKDLKSLADLLFLRGFILSCD